MNILSFIKWYMIDQFMLHMAEPDVVVDPEPDPTPDPEPAPKWSDTWREDFTNGDPDKVSKLSRYASPTAAIDAMIAAQHKISSGDYKKAEPFPSEGTDEEKAAWRTTNGLPESPDKYEFTFDNGLVIGEEDKPLIDDFTAFAFEKNVPTEQAKASIEWYYSFKEKQAEARAEKDAEIKSQSEDALRAEWGEEYRANINRIHGLLDTAPEGVKENIMNARLPDGTPLGVDAATLRFLTDLAVQINPATTLVPGAGDNIVGAISDELNDLKAKMGNPNSEYWKGPKADSMQKRYRDLLEAQSKMKK